MTPYYRVKLQAIYTGRKKENPRYSFGAFARDLGVDKSTVSKLLSGKRRPSRAFAEKLAQSLALSPEEKTRFLASLILNDEDMKAVSDQNTSRLELDSDVFTVICQLHHYAILELCAVPGSHHDAASLARRLRLTRIEAEAATARLRRLGLLTEVGGHLTKTAVTVTTTDRHLTSHAHKLHQQQILRLAMKSLSHDPLEVRAMMGTTLAIDTRRIPDAKIMIRNFLESLCQFLESGEQTEVYQMGISLFPLEKAFANE